MPQISNRGVILNFSLYLSTQTNEFFQCSPSAPSIISYNKLKELLYKCDVLKREYKYILGTEHTVQSDPFKY